MGRRRGEGRGQAETTRKATRKTTRKTAMKAASRETIIPESSEEKRLWMERGRLEQGIERKEKVIHNAQERLLKARWLWKDDRPVLESVVATTRIEIDKLREDITAVDEEIRAGELSEWKEAIRNDEEAKAMEAAAREAKEISHALGEARQRMKVEAQNISELEAKLKRVGAV